MTTSQKRTMLYMTYFTLFVLGVILAVTALVFAFTGLGEMGKYVPMGRRVPVMSVVGGIYVLLAGCGAIAALIFDVYSTFSRKRRFLDFIFVYSLLPIFLVAVLVAIISSNSYYWGGESFIASALCGTACMLLLAFMYFVGGRIAEFNGGTTTQAAGAGSDTQELALRFEVADLKKEARLRELRREIEALKESLK